MVSCSTLPNPPSGYWPMPVRPAHRTADRTAGAQLGRAQRIAPRCDGGQWLGAGLRGRGTRPVGANRAPTPARCCAIGADGQTVRHQPGAFDGTGYTLQLNNPPFWLSCAALMWSPISAAAMSPPADRARRWCQPFHQARVRRALGGASGACSKYCGWHRANTDAGLREADRGRHRRLRLRPRQCLDGRLVPGTLRCALRPRAAPGLPVARCGPNCWRSCGVSLFSP